MEGRVDTLIFQSNRKHGIRQHFDRISGFQVALAYARLARELPARGDVVDEGVIKRFRDLVAERGYVFKSTTEDPRRDKAGEIGDPTALWRAAVREVSVEAQHAAA